MENTTEHISDKRRHINGWKILLPFLSIIAFGLLGGVYTLHAYPQVFHIDISLEKNNSIDPAEPIVINFSQSVSAENYSNNIKISPATDFAVKWENSNKKLVISPKTFWKPETQYSLTLPEGKSTMLIAVNMAMFKFSTVNFPKLTSVYPEKGAKNVTIDIEDPIVLKFDGPLKNFFVKLELDPSSDLTYKYNDDRTQFELLPKGPLEYGTDYAVKAYIKYADDTDANYHQIYTGSFSTEAPPVITWDKDFATRIEQAKKYTTAKITTGKYIDINLEAQVLSTFENGKLLDSYMVSSGKRGMETPKGQFSIHNKAPRVWSKKYGLFMPFWMAVASDGSFGIHELPEWPGGYKEGAAHLGIPVSHGCIRLGVGPAKTVYDWTEVGMPVVIY